MKQSEEMQRVIEERLGLRKREEILSDMCVIFINALFKKFEECIEEEGFAKKYEKAKYVGFRVFVKAKEILPRWDGVVFNKPDYSSLYVPIDDSIQFFDCKVVKYLTDYGWMVYKFEEDKLDKFCVLFKKRN